MLTSRVIMRIKYVNICEAFRVIPGTQEALKKCWLLIVSVSEVLSVLLLQVLQRFDFIARKQSHRGGMPCFKSLLTSMGPRLECPPPGPCSGALFTVLGVAY